MPALHAHIAADRQPKPTYNRDARFTQQMRLDCNSMRFHVFEWNSPLMPTALRVVY